MDEFRVCDECGRYFAGAQEEGWLGNCGADWAGPGDVPGPGCPLRVVEELEIK